MCASPADSSPLPALRRANAFLRAENAALADRLSLLSDAWAAPDNGGGVALRARLTAHERRARLLRAALDERGAALAALRDECARSSQELAAARSEQEERGKDKEERDPTAHAELARRWREAQAEREEDRAEMAALREDCERRGEMIVGLQRENAALRETVAQLVAYVRDAVYAQAEDGQQESDAVEDKEREEDAAERRVRTYRERHRVPR